MPAQNILFYTKEGHTHRNTLGDCIPRNISLSKEVSAVPAWAWNALVCCSVRACMWSQLHGQWAIDWQHLHLGRASLLSAHLQLRMRKVLTGLYCISRGKATPLFETQDSHIWGPMFHNWQFSIWNCQTASPWREGNNTGLFYSLDHLLCILQSSFIKSAVEKYTGYTFYCL